MRGAQGTAQQHLCWETPSDRLDVITCAAENGGGTPEMYHIGSYSTYPILLVHLETISRPLLITTEIQKAASTALICRILVTWAQGGHLRSYKEVPPALHQSI